jgi:TetR/AcrR family transcriptional repressor of nem operon
LNLIGDLDYSMARAKEFEPDKALEAAMHLFWLKGYKAASVLALCDSMGIKKGSLYDTFGNKRSLFLAALEQYRELNRLQPDLNNKAGSAKSAIAGIFDQVVDESVNDEQCRGCFVVNTIVELTPHDPWFERESSIRRQEFEGMFHDLLVVALENGEISPNQDLVAISRFLTNALFGLRVTAKTTRERTVLEDIVSSTLAILK